MSQLATLDSQLQSRYARSPLNPDVTWSLGSAVAAFYDDCLYRAKIVGFDDDGIEVLRTAVLKCVCWIFWQREAQFLSRRSRLSDHYDPVSPIAKAQAVHLNWVTLVQWLACLTAECNDHTNVADSSCCS